MAGRHRAPRPQKVRNTSRRTAIIAATAVAPIAVPLAVSDPITGAMWAQPVAEAPVLPRALPTATDAAWDAVAECESSGDWSIDTGNGFSGGLQFTPSTWSGFGGGEFAADASDATREEQIVVAERVLAEQGWGAWPTCSVQAGVTGQSATQRDAPSDSQRDSTPPSTSVQPPPTTTTVPPSTSATPSSPQPRATDPDPPTQPLRTIRPDGTYVVVPRDTLSEIAYDLTRGSSAEALASASNIKDPDKIWPGDIVRVISPSGQALPEMNTGGTSDSTTEQPSTSQSPTSSRTTAPAAPIIGDSDDGGSNTESSVENDSATSSGGSHSASSDIIGTARTWIGVPYEWGGTTRSGVDCSGLVQRVFAAHGISLPRTSAQQANATERITRAEARAGDLVFGTTDGRVSHVGIYLGGGRMIDAPTSGQTVGIHELYSNTAFFGRVQAD